MLDRSLLSTLLPFVFPHIPHVRVVFSTSLTGNMSLTKETLSSEKRAIGNIKKSIMQAYSIDQWFEVHQVHGNDIIEAPHQFDIQSPPVTCADGLYTSQKGHALTIRTADCQPILLAHTKGKFIAAIHVGWRGNVCNFPHSAVSYLCKKYTTPASEIMAVRGPSLGPGQAEFIHFEKEWPKEYSPWFKEKTKTLDLWSISRHQLELSGVKPQNIFSLDMCTKSLPELFFSHRNGHMERQVAAIWIDKGVTSDD